jgi:hypothetical protein
LSNLGFRCRKSSRSLLEQRRCGRWTLCARKPRTSLGSTFGTNVLSGNSV